MADDYKEDTRTLLESYITQEKGEFPKDASDPIVAGESENIVQAANVNVHEERIRIEEQLRREEEARREEQEELLRVNTEGRVVVRGAAIPILPRDSICHIISPLEISSIVHVHPNTY